MKNIIIGLFALSAISSFADSVCKTLVPSNAPFGGWLNAQLYDEDSYTYCADMTMHESGVYSLTNLTVFVPKYRYFPVETVEAKKYNAKHFCKFLGGGKLINYKKSDTKRGVSLLGTVTSEVFSPRNSNHVIIKAPIKNAAFETVTCLQKVPD